MRRLAWVVIAFLALRSVLEAQVPQPFPRPGQSPQSPARPAPAAPQPAQPAPAQAVSVPPAGEVPTEATLGLPVYPTAQYITSYDAGHGQRYYLFGSDARFPALVQYYQTALKTKGSLVFEAPATHVFEVGKFDEKTMAFPPGVTIKDYTWNGSEGYLNPKKDGKPLRFATIIQIVPAPAASPR
jgi:hypothetical protein